MGNKRKLKTKDEEQNAESADVPAKSRKSQDNDTKAEEDGDEAVREPSKQEIEESFKPENTPNIPTIRGKKKKVTKQIQEKNKESNEARDIEAVKVYLTKWKDDRESWKFEKRKQVFIQNNCFEPTKVHDDDWSACLEYLEGSKGKGRDELVAKAEKIITELDSSGDLSAEQTIKYTRARDLLQMLN